MTDSPDDEIETFTKEGDSPEAETPRPSSRGGTPKGGLVPVRVPQPHGGTLQRGSALPGPGALPGRIRATLRDDFEARLAFLRAVVDGELVQRIAFHVNDLRPYVACAVCGGSTMVPVQMTRNRDAGRVEVAVDAAASPKDRLSALDMMAKYGIGTLKEVSTETVRGKVAETLHAIRKECDPETTERLYVLLREVWK